MSSSKIISRTGRVLSGVTPSVTVTDMSTAVSQSQSSSSQKTITMQNLNPNIIKLQYAVRGPLVIRSAVIQRELLEGKQKPFKRVVSANIGDAHAMGQKPISFIRQVLSCTINPELMQCSCYPADVIERAIGLIQSCGGGSAGSYTASHGIEMIRKHVAEYIERRDGHKANWEDICFGAGASTCIKNCLQLLCSKVDGKSSGVMIPIPQYPLYSASLAEYGLGQVGYYLDEDNNWGIEIQELERAYRDGSNEHTVRGLVVINPGNPTGQVLSEKNIQDILKFAARHKLFVFADEVYQDNVYAEGSQFHSFKKVMTEMGPPCSNLELASFMSISKGYMGECGLRGGWMELMNMDKEVQANLYKAISAMLCPNTMGQFTIDMTAKPPAYGEPSYYQWAAEKAAVLESLKERANMIVETFNNMEGFSCNVVQGAMYAFPRIHLPVKAVAAAKAENKPADVFYAFRLLEETGICIIPGSGFGQRPNTYHFRTTILPQPEMLKEMLEIFQKFHQKFTKEFS